MSKFDFYSQGNTLQQAKFLRQPKTDGYLIVKLLPVRCLLKGFRAAQQYASFGNLLSYESEIYSSLIQKPNMP